MPSEPLDDEILALFHDVGVVVTSELQGRMVAAYCRPLLREEGWTKSMALHALELWIDSGYLNQEADDEVE